MIDGILTGIGIGAGFAVGIACVWIICYFITELYEKILKYYWK